MENSNLKKLLDEEIVSEIRQISTLKIGSNEKGCAIDDLVKLYKLKIEERKIDLDESDKVNRRKMDENINIRDDELKQKQMKEQIKERYFRIGTATAELVIPLVFYGIWMRKGFKFEETGTYTSKTFMGLINRFKPTKK